MSSGSDSPPKFDGAGAAAQQGRDNLSAARSASRLSNPNITNMYGSRVITRGADGNEDNVQITDSLNPQQQALFEQQQRINSTLGGAAEGLSTRIAGRQPFSFSGAGDTVDRAEAAIMSRLNPQMDRAREAEKARLITGGHAVGSEGNTVATDARGRQENDARMQAILAALGYAPKMLQMEKDVYNQPLEELNTLRGNSQATAPTFQGYTGTQVAPAPSFAGAQAGYQGELAGYNAGVASDNALMSGLFSLGGAAIGAPPGAMGKFGAAFRG